MEDDNKALRKQMKDIKAGQVVLDNNIKQVYTTIQDLETRKDGIDAETRVNSLWVIHTDAHTCGNGY